MYQALYRKYRPDDFDSVVGQEPIIKTLRNSIKNHNFSHAYMFFGPRGIGKTTLSKIFARNINCLNSNDGIACKKCKNCEISFSKNCVDIIEIDAASNNGVDEIRDLKNRISLVPSDLNYKVYIIDEVHMLSIGAFNALLKTLEDPPEHAIFILATTDSQKVPDTVISRCQCFNFKRISPEIIKVRLSYVCSKENIDIDDDVLVNISELSDGGLRDALGMLDKLVSYTDTKITMDDFVMINAIASDDALASFLKNVMLGNISDVLSDINNFSNCGKNLIQIFIQILNYSRNMIIDYYLYDKEIDYSVNILQEFVNLLNEKTFDIKKSSQPKIFFEIFMLKFINDFVLNNNDVFSCGEKLIDKGCNKDIDIKNDSLLADIVDTNIITSDKNVEYNESLINNNSNLSSVKILNIDEIMKIRVNNTLALANKSLLKKEIENLSLLNDFVFDQKIGYIVCSILDSKIRAVSNENIIFSFENDSNVKQNLSLLDKFSEVYNQITNSNKKIAIISDDYWNFVRNEYVNNLKNKVKYKVIEEPEVIFEDFRKNDIITSSAIDLFGGDIVEIE